jgi:hypothetical protein
LLTMSFLNNLGHPEVGGAIRDRITAFIKSKYPHHLSPPGLYF